MGVKGSIVDKRISQNYIANRPDKYDLLLHPNLRGCYEK